MTDDLERRLREVRAFLNGEAPLYGHWFGDSVPSVEGRPRAFWWRQYLTCLTEAADEIARLRAENEALREALGQAERAFNAIAHEALEGSERGRKEGAVWWDSSLGIIATSAIRNSKRARQALQEGSRHE